MSRREKKKWEEKLEDGHMQIQFHVLTLNFRVKRLSQKDVWKTLNLKKERNGTTQTFCEGVPGTGDNKEKEQTHLKA